MEWWQPRANKSCLCNEAGVLVGAISKKMGAMSAEPADDDDCAVCGTVPPHLAPSDVLRDQRPPDEETGLRCPQTVWANITAKTRAKGQRPNWGKNLGLIIIEVMRLRISDRGRVALE
jgi:hypothetical protein